MEDNYTIYDKNSGLKTRNITNPVVTEYLNSLYKTPDCLSDLRSSAEKDGVPIITKEAESFLSFILGMIRPEKILEIGCAIGYSSMFFSYVTGAEVYTVEKDHDTYITACRNIKAHGFDDKIHVYEGDGEDMIKALENDGIKGFDMVFIDAAKSHYKRFFDAALRIVSDDCILIGDNVLFQAKVAADEYDIGGKHKTNVRKLREFNEYIMTDPRFDSTIIAVSDGISITRIKSMSYPKID